MLLEALLDLCKLLLVVYSLRLALRTYVQSAHPTWSAPLARRRLAVLLALVLAVIAIKVVEDVLTGESGIVDGTILLFVHRSVPDNLTDFFQAVTFTGSSSVLLPLTVAATVALLFARRRFEALLLATSATSAAALVYLIKIAVNRERPALWVTDWYWGSSFPSGHTLVVAAVATALALSANRAWPRARPVAIGTAAAWIGLVALSRLVLGVHWPTDVLAAACIGAILPLALSVALDLRHA